MTKTFRDNCDKNIVQQTSCEPLFPDVQMQSKMYFFVPFIRPCMRHNYGGISESHACKDCLWPIILDAELYTTCPRERVLVVMTHQGSINVPSGVFKGRRAKHLPRVPPFSGPPLRCYARTFFLILMKNLLFTHIMYYKADHK